jgi:hypothetical protein
MARPKKNPGELKAEFLAFRLTPAERLQIEEAASKAGMSAAAYTRMLALKGRVVIRQQSTLDHAAFDQLRRIGVNLNQLTRLANATGKIPPGLSRTFAAIHRILEQELSGQGAGRPEPPPPPPKPPSGLADGP